MSDPHTVPTGPDHGDDALDAATMLRLLEHQQDAVSRRLAAAVPWILGAWGVAWLVGFGLLWAIDGTAADLGVPAWLAASAFAALMAAALVVTAVLGIRSGRGIRVTRATAFTTMVYGIAWGAGFVALGVLGAALLANGMEAELAGIFYPTGSALLVGLLYLIGGGVWHTRTAVVMGAWILLVAAVAPILGSPAHFLVLSLAGGGGFLAVAIGSGVWVAGARSRFDGAPDG